MKINLIIGPFQNETVEVDLPSPPRISDRVFTIDSGFEIISNATWIIDLDGVQVNVDANRIPE